MMHPEFADPERRTSHNPMTFPGDIATRIAYIRGRIAENPDCSAVYLMSRDKVRAAIMSVEELEELLRLWERDRAG